MIRKKLTILIVLSLLLLTICSCGDDNDTSKINLKSMDLYTANHMDNLVTKAGENIHMSGHEKGSKYEVHYTFTVGLDENGEKFYLYTESNGYEEIVKGGKGYGYSASSGKLFLLAYLDDAYESRMNDFWNSFPLTKDGDYENDDQYMTSVKKNGDDIIVNYNFLDLNKTAGEGSRVLVTYFADAKTLFIKGSKTIFTKADGTVTITRDTTAERNKAYTIDEKYKYIFTSNKTRTVTAIINPGTTEEQTEVFTSPIDVAINFAAPVGMDKLVYSDAACTIPLSEEQHDANGNYPLESTVYIRLFKK